MSWYDKDEVGRKLYDFQLASLEKFKKQYNNPDFKYEIQTLEDSRLAILINLPVKIKESEDDICEQWNFLMVYENDYPQDKEFTPAIKMYPISPITKPFHVLLDGSGNYYLSILTCSEERNSIPSPVSVLYATIRWIVAYHMWEHTERQD